MKWTISNQQRPKSLQVASSFDTELPHLPYTINVVLALHLNGQLVMLVTTDARVKGSTPDYICDVTIFTEAHRLPRFFTIIQ